MEECSVIGSTCSLASLPNADASIDEFNIVEIEELEEDTPSEQVYETKEKNEPYLGQEFSSLEEAKNFYNKYAFKTGFSIRKSTHYKAKKQDNMITSVTYTCSKEGQCNSKLTIQEKRDHESLQNNNTSKKEISLRRMGCKAHMRVRLVKTTKWTVTTFTMEHNHELIVSPSKARFFRSHRTITLEQKELIHMLSEQNITPSQIMAFLETREGGRSNIKFTRKDLSNEVVEKNKRLVGIDVASALNYFRELQMKDPLFFYAIDVDEEQKARNIFWVDGKSRMVYQYFGDVIIFDTTYMTNKYSMPFAPFKGVNHHLQSIFFGCSLIRNETADTFCWLFETWMKAMYGQYPKAIITDQDPAMKKAIEQVFPNTVHRCCQWHIMRKAKEHLGVLYSSKVGFEDELKDCINESLTIDDFQTWWAMMLDKYQLHDNKYLQLLWNIRHQWVPAYFRDIFFANMSTSQRSESMNAVVKIWLDSHSSIYKFVTQFEKMSTSQYEREDFEDFMTKDGDATLWSHDPIEKEAREIYTRTMFLEFKAQLKAATGYAVNELEKDSLYKISKFSNPSNPNQGISEYIVTIIKEEGKVLCTCKFFDFYGILCSHALRAMNYAGIHNIPPHFVMKRTKDAKKGTSSTNMAACDDDSFRRTRRFDSLIVMAQSLFQKVQRVMGHMRQHVKRFKKVFWNSH